MVVAILDSWMEQDSRIAWSRWKGVEEYYIDKIRFDKSKLSQLAPKHPAFESGFRFSDWSHFIPSDAISRLRSSKEFESEYIDIVSEIFDNIEQDLDDDIIPLEAQWNDEYVQESTYEERRLAIEAFLCRVLTLQLRGDVNFEKITSGDTEIPAEPSIDPSTGPTSVSVERLTDLDQADVIRFSISDPSDFFETTFGDNTLMFERLLHSSKEPELVESSVELDKPGVIGKWRIHTGISYSE